MPDLADLPPCVVCALPARKPVCSERCRGLRPLKAAADAVGPRFDAALLSLLRACPRGETLDPGATALRILSDLGAAPRDARDALAVVRGRCLALREQGLVRFYQRGRLLPPGKTFVRGPWRLGR
jgi:hypothetical protein